LTGVLGKDFNFRTTLKDMKQLVGVWVQLPWTGTTCLRPEHAHVAGAKRSESGKLHFFKLGYLLLRIEHLILGHMFLLPPNVVLSSEAPWRDRC